MKPSMDTQTKEFAAAHDFAEKLGQLECTAIVDDDYPEVRHYYESSLRRLIDALKANGRLP